MRQISRWFQIGNLITALEGAHNYGNPFISVTSLQGWEETPQKEIETAASLYGNGSYVSSLRVPEKTVEITLTVFGRKVKDVINSLNDLYEGSSPVSLKRSFSWLSLSDAYRTEAHEAYLTEIKDVLQHSDDYGTFTLVFLVPNPVMQITGSSTTPSPPSPLQLSVEQVFMKDDGIGSSLEITLAQTDGVYMDSEPRVDVKVTSDAPGFHAGSVYISTYMGTWTDVYPVGGVMEFGFSYNDWIQHRESPSPLPDFTVFAGQDAEGFYNIDISIHGKGMQRTESTYFLLYPLPEL